MVVPLCSGSCTAAFHQAVKPIGFNSSNARSHHINAVFFLTDFGKRVNYLFCLITCIFSGNLLVYGCLTIEKLHNMVVIRNTNII